MKKLYNEFFYIPKHAKVCEKVMLTRLIMLVAIVIMSLTAMSITAYGFFSYDITSGTNVIKAANFETKVSIQITDEDGNAVENSQIVPATSDHKNFEIRDLEVGKAYTVTISQIKDETAAKTGFIIVSADNCPDTYHTQQLGIDEKADGGKTEKLTFKLMITDSTVVHLKAHWGTSCSYLNYQNKDDEFYIIQNEEIKMIVNGKDINKGDDNNTDSQDASGTTPIDTTNISNSVNQAVIE